MLKVITLFIILLSNNIYASTSEIDLKQEAVKRYLRAMPVKVMMTDLVNAVSRNMRPDQAKSFKNIMINHVDFVQFEKIIIAGMSKSLSLAELNALADFYSSDIAKSAMKKMSVYMVEMQPDIQLLMKNAIEKSKRK